MSFGTPLGYFKSSDSATKAPPKSPGPEPGGRPNVPLLHKMNSASKFKFSQDVISTEQMIYTAPPRGSLDAELMLSIPDDKKTKHRRPKKRVQAKKIFH